MDQKKVIIVGVVILAVVVILPLVKNTVRAALVGGAFWFAYKNLATP